MAQSRVEFLDKMGGDIDVVNAARVSFKKRVAVLRLADKDLIEYLATGLRKKERATFRNRVFLIGSAFANSEIPRDEFMRQADFLIDDIQAIVKHWVPFTHVVAKFHFMVPIFVARQIHRSTTGFTLSEESRRYVDDEPEFFRFDSWRGRAEDVKQGSGGPIAEQSEAEALYQAAVEQGAASYDGLLRLGAAPEQARAALTLGTMTSFVWTANLYAWANLCRQRLDGHAQYETRVVAQAISATMTEIAAVSWRALVTRGREIAV